MINPNNPNFRVATLRCKACDKVLSDNDMIWYDYLDGVCVACDKKGTKDDNCEIHSTRPLPRVWFER